jgi:hypothetical protein
MLKTALATALLPFPLMVAVEPLPDGQELARSMRERPPEKATEIQATLEVFEKDGKRNTSSLLIEATSIRPKKWCVTYKARSKVGVIDLWRICHSFGEANHYEHNERLAKPSEIHKGLADSAFTLSDLGMEFLYWPSQIVLKTQRRKSRLCYVLESRNPNPSNGEHHRVVSWVDQKTGGILLADLYNASPKPVKRFSVKGLTKKNGRWQVDEMEMRDMKSRARSRLQFHLK